MQFPHFAFIANTTFSAFTGSGTPPDDLLFSSTQLLFGSGTVEGDSVCVTVTGISDDDVEGTEYLAVNIESNSSYNVNGGGTAFTDSVTIMVLDADGKRSSFLLFVILGVT